VAAEMLKASLGYLFSKNRVIEVLPAPDGAVMMMILCCNIRGFELQIKAGLF
jgi:hypothetical protein